MSTKTPPRSTTPLMTGTISTPGPTYLPMNKPSTSSRLTTTRTYRPQSYGTFIHYFTFNNVGHNNWVPRSRRPTKSWTTKTTTNYDYLKPFIPFDPTNGKQ